MIYVFIKTYVRVELSIFMMYIVRGLHIKPHRSFGMNELEDAESSLTDHNVAVIHVTNSSANNYYVSVPCVGLHVFYDRNQQFMSVMPYMFHRLLFVHLLCRKAGVVDSKRTENIKGKNDVRVLAHFGFRRAQLEDKGSSVGISKDSYDFQNSPLME